METQLERAAKEYENMEAKLPQQKDIDDMEKLISKEELMKKKSQNLFGERNNPSL
jgi:hypothetical protein